MDGPRNANPCLPPPLLLLLLLLRWLRLQRLWLACHGCQSLQAGAAHRLLVTAALSCNKN
jgi:hypothetical protein